MDQTQALQNLLNGTASEEDINLLKGGLASGEISIGGNVNQSVIIIGNGNTVELPPAALDRLGGRSLLGDLDRDLTGDEIALGLNRLGAELPLRAPVLQTQFQEQTRRLRPSLKTNPKSLSDHSLRERVEALAQINSLCMEALDISFNALCLGEEPPEYDSRSPFRGLESFRPEDSEFFFGREVLTKKLVAKIQLHPFLAVLGASGSGKSSLVMAGLIPSLGTEYVIFRPGANPLEALDAIKENALVVVDQFEELFTLTREESIRKGFIKALLEFSKTNRVVITMRADFWGEIAVYKELKQAMQDHQELIAPMDLDELCRAMEGQANQVGLRFEADLSQQILDSIEGEPGAMPLLQHALWELWNRRHGRNLRASEYRAFGGVKQAIASTAENVYDEYTKAEQEQIRDIFLRLTRLDYSDEGRDTRRRVSISELILSGRDAVSITLLLDKLANARLIVKTVNEDKTEIEVAHEALIRHWERLRTWLNEDRDNLRLREGIIDAARQWNSGKREESLLIHRAGRLDDAIYLSNDSRYKLNDIEQAYLDTCVTLKDKERRKQGVRNIAIVAVVVLAVIVYFYQSSANSRNLVNQSASFANTQVAVANTSQAIAVTAQFNEKAAESAKATAVANQIRADQNAEEAKKNAEEARKQALFAISDNLSSLALSRFETDYIQSLLLGVESNELLKVNGLDTGHNPDILPALLQKTENGWTQSLSSPPSGTVWKIAYSSDGKWMAAVSNSIDLWDTNDPLSPKHIKSWPTSQESRASDIAFNPNSTMLAIGYVDGRVDLWDIQELKEIRSIKDLQTGILTDVKVAFNPDGNLLAISANKQISILNLASPNSSDTYKFPQNPHNYKNITKLFFLPSYTNHLVSIGEDNFVRIWDLQNPQSPKQIDSVSGDDGIISMAVSNYQPYGIVLASNRYLYFYNAKFTRIGDFNYSNDQSEPIHTMVFNPAKQQLFTASSDGTIAVWDVSKVWLPSNAPIEISLMRKYSGHASLVNSMAFHKDGNVFSSGGYDSKIILWNIAEDSSPAIWQSYKITYEEDVTDIAYSPKNDFLAVGYKDGNIQMWNISNPTKKSVRPFMHLPTNQPVLQLGFISNENLLFIMGGKSGKYLGNVITQDIFTNANSAPPLLIGLEEIDFFAFNNKYILAGKNISNNVITIFPWDISRAKPRRGEQVGTTTCPSKNVATSRDGNLIAIASCSVQLWDFSNDKIPVMIDEEIVLNPLSVAFSWDGKMLASGNGDNSITLWSISAGKTSLITEIINAHQKPVTGIAFSSDGKLLASVGEDQAVVLWDISNPKKPVKRFILKGHLNKILNGSIFISGDGKTIISASKSEVILWDIDSQSWLEKACNIVGRNFTKLEWEQLLGKEPYHRTCPKWSEGQ